MTCIILSHRVASFPCKWRHRARKSNDGWALSVKRSVCHKKGSLQDGKPQTKINIFWRRKSKITSKINKQNWFSCRNTTTENCFISYPWDWKKKTQDMRHSGLYRCNHGVHTCSANTDESENILHYSTVGYLCSPTIWMYMYINTKKKTTSMPHNLFTHANSIIQQGLWIL